jgi:hypothetical protein
MLGSLRARLAPSEVSGTAVGRKAGDRQWVVDRRSDPNEPQAGSVARPAHKFTRAIDLSWLAALLRKFLRLRFPNIFALRTRFAPRDDEFAQPSALGFISSSPPPSPKQHEKRNQCWAKRNEMFRSAGGKLLKLL